VTVRAALLTLLYFLGLIAFGASFGNITEDRAIGMMIIGGGMIIYAAAYALAAELKSWLK
jgi:hypothetical protein